MGWIKPKSVTFRKIWIPVEENDYFTVLKRNTTISLINEVVSLIPQNEITIISDFKICLKNKYFHCIGESNEWEEIQSMWSWINENILPSIQKMNNDPTEIFEYLCLKFSCLGIHEENFKTQEKQRELKDKDQRKKEKNFKKRFSLESETLITQYSCSLMDKIQRHGCMYISENYICFYSRIIPTKIKVLFSDIVEMKKTTHSSYFKFLTDSIKIQTESKEFIFHTFFKVDETFQLLDQIRKFAMNRMLFAAEKNNNSSSSSPLSSSSPQLVNSQTGGGGVSTCSPAFINRSNPLSVSHHLYPSAPSNTPSSSLKQSGSYFSQSSPNESSSFSTYLYQLSLSPPTSGAGPAGYEPHFSTHYSSPLTATANNNWLTGTGYTSPFAPSSPSASTPTSLNNSICMEYQQQQQYQLHQSYGYGGGGCSPNTQSMTTPNSNHYNVSSFKEMLQEQRKHQDYQTLFGLPTSELLVEEFHVTLWKSHPQDIVGKLYLSNNFLCFGSIDLQLVLPLREICTISNEKAFGNRGQTMRITIDKQQHFYFFSNQIETHYDIVRQFWKDANPSIQNGTNSSGIFEPLHQVIGMPDQILENSRDFSNTYKLNQVQQSHLWDQYFSFHGEGISMIKTDELKALIRGGIPDQHRRLIWMLTSGSLYKPYCHPPGYYQHLLEQHKNETNQSTIDISKDLKRSFPEHPFYQSEQGIQSLRNILTAYSWRNPSVGYCQSMNIIAAIFLLFLKEEEAFWLLCTLCEDYVPDNYRPGMVGSIADGKTFEYLFSTYLTDLDNHLKKLNCPVSMIILPWFLCLFIGSGHMELGLRVVDCFFNEGTNVLFQVALCCLKMNETAILNSKSAEEIMNIVKNTRYNVDHLLTIVLSEFDNIQPDKIEQLRSSNKFMAIKNIQISNKKQKIREWSDRYNLSKTELEKLYDLFQSYISISASKLGIGIVKFFELCKSVLPSAWCYKGAFINNIFKLLDEDMDDLITCDDFVHMVAITTKGTLNEKIKFCFDLYDHDNDDNINANEFKTLLESLICLLNPSNQTTSFDIDSLVSSMCISEASVFSVDDVESNFIEIANNLGIEYTK
ncbi:hypothetical protein PPL_02225 [Heterostelium album PN500]|uniref:Uncharacterized protein n=1 Tax=Heterostelium pallidum (strain ATCC 26659 / Pp 5 / PN500) TaxID=670386 RepID=D3B1Q1_HETP5|nr:hypothetical protein PPL_02225 [Heterostelium album PN500]EFA85225.1 hypothetical protein PPL_02225 [Heterostelium album PN500]|eukprot:XP_020437334.1 hypothetical protein PPL_02225 [Heterostelium album PN500]